MTPAPYTAYELSSPDGQRAVLAVFATGTGGDGRHVFFPRSTKPSARYLLTFGDGETAETSGLELSRFGIPVFLPNESASELIFIDRI